MFGIRDFYKSVSAGFNWECHPWHYRLRRQVTWPAKLLLIALTRQESIKFQTPTVSDGHWS